MGRRRRRSAFRIGGFRGIARLFLLAILGLGAYIGRDSWQPAPSANPGAQTGSSAASHAQPPSSTPNDSGGADRVFVERVVDGDTLVIAGGDRVRLIGVDTPETHHPTKPAQPFGQEAYEFTRRMVEGKRVELQFDSGESVDRYGRTLAYVYVEGQFLNEILLRQGLARALTNYPFSSEMKARFRAAEAQAKAAHRGVWSLPQSPFEVTSKPTPKKAG